AEKEGAEKEDKGEQDKPKVPDKPAEPARKNWFTVAFSPDVSVVSGSNVCANSKQEMANPNVSGQYTAHYVCLRQDAMSSRYKGTPTLNNADNINTGLALSTLRIMLGYDRLIIDNLTLGLRAGFAFNGASGGGASFLPLHLEARLGIWPGHTPF